MQVAEKGKCPFMHPSISQWGSRCIFWHSWGTGPVATLTDNVKQHNKTHVDSFTVAYRKNNTMLHFGQGLRQVVACRALRFTAAAGLKIRFPHMQSCFELVTTSRSASKCLLWRSGFDKHHVGGQTNQTSKIDQLFSLFLNLKVLNRALMSTGV